MSPQRSAHTLMMDTWDNGMGLPLAADDAQQPPVTAVRLPRRIRFLGHASLLIDLDDTRIVTDPLLRRRVSGLYWRHPSPHSAVNHPVDAVVISHMHQDHLDIPSLRLLGADTPLLVPSRAGQFLARRGFSRATEMQPGDAADVFSGDGLGSVRIVATPARHTGFRPPFGPWGHYN